LRHLGGGGAGEGEAEDFIRRRAGEQQLAGVLSDEELTRAAAVLATGSVTDQKLGAILKQASVALDARSRIAMLTQCFLTSSGDARKSLMTAKLRASFPDL